MSACIISMIEQLTHPLDSIALQDDQQTVTYGQLKATVLARVQSLNEVTVLGLALDNSVEWVLWDLAAQYAGITCVPLPDFFSDEQREHTLLSAGVSHIRTHNALTTTGITPSSLIPAGTRKITYTSGTSGTPKGVCLSLEAMTSVCVSLVDLLGAQFTGIHVCILPLPVLLENIAGVYTGLLAGCHIQLPTTTQLGENYINLHHYLTSTQASSIIVVPEILQLLMSQVQAMGPLPAMQFIAVGGSKVNQSLLSQAIALGLPVYEGYGLSECASVVSLNTPHQCRIGSVGKILPHIGIDIIDNEIVLSPPGFLGYVGEPIQPPFFTGDLGIFSNDGFLSITGRKKNVLITATGRNISPEWIESLLLSLPDIAQAIVTGDGETYLSALIVPTGTQHNIKTALEKINHQLPHYARIQRAYCVTPFTLANKQLTGTGRPRRDVILHDYNTIPKRLGTPLILF